jgi:putative peptide zinc metalloprotease protein
VRRVAALVLAALVALVPAAHGQGDTTAVAVNTRDGADVFRLAFAIRRVMSETADTDNAAAAVASCTDCQTIALAFQVVLLFENPDELTTDNLAIAINTECSLCDTLASAYQLVLTTGGPVHFSADGNQRIQEIRRKLLELRDSGLSSFEIQEQVDALYEELKQVVTTELEPAGPPATSTTTTTIDDDSGTSTTSTTSTTEGPTTTTSTPTSTTSTTTTTSTTEPSP